VRTEGSAVFALVSFFVVVPAATGAGAWVGKAILGMLGRRLEDRLHASKLVGSLDERRSSCDSVQPDDVGYASPVERACWRRDDAGRRGS
jgi:hypothetical protein